MRAWGRPPVEAPSTTTISSGFGASGIENSSVMKCDRAAASCRCFIGICIEVPNPPRLLVKVRYRSLRTRSKAFATGHGDGGY